MVQLVLVHSYMNRVTAVGAIFSVILIIIGYFYAKVRSVAAKRTADGLLQNAHSGSYACFFQALLVLLKLRPPSTARICPVI